MRGAQDKTGSLKNEEQHRILSCGDSGTGQLRFQSQTMLGDLQTVAGSKLELLLERLCTGVQLFAKVQYIA